jgi:acetate kinase
MGFGGVSGLPMATRSGDVPADALFYILRAGILNVEGLEKALYHNSGLLGLSGLTGDMRELQVSKDPRAIAAVDNFVYAMTKYVGAYVSVLGGLDALVFTAGIGEHSSQVRAALCRKLNGLGVKLEEKANRANELLISSPSSAISVWVIPTNEELMIAEHTRMLTGRAEHAAVMTA